MTLPSLPRESEPPLLEGGGSGTEAKAESGDPKSLGRQPTGLYYYYRHMWTKRDARKTKQGLPGGDLCFLGWLNGEGERGKRY